MANTYSKIYIHVIFAVKHRESLLSKDWREQVYKYIAVTINSRGQKCFIINGTETHIHILLGMKPNICLNDLIRDIKNTSTNFINQRILKRKVFNWQESFSSFSCSQSLLDKVYKYIENQEEHHRVKTFKEECIAFYKKYNIDY